MILPVWEHSFPEWVWRATRPTPREPDFLGSGMSVWDLYSLGHAESIRVHEERFGEAESFGRDDLVFGGSALFVMYAVQGSMLLFGPPWVKAAAVAWIFTPMVDPIVFGLGVSVGDRWFG